MKTKPDYFLKAQILEEKTQYSLFTSSKKVLNKFYFTPESCTYEEFENALNLLNYLEKDNPSLYAEYRRIYGANCHRLLRLKTRIAYMVLNHDCLFLTFTFTDDAFKRTSATTRRRMVGRFLNSYNTLYVANVDYGKKNEREHYHAVIATNHVDFSKWKYGAINGEKIRNDLSFDENGEITSECSVKLAKYVAKLTNHAIKKTTKRSVIMYSRKYGMLDRLKKEEAAIKKLRLYNYVVNNDEPLNELYVQDKMNLED